MIFVCYLAGIYMSLYDVCYALHKSGDYLDCPLSLRVDARALVSGSRAWIPIGASRVTSFRRLQIHGNEAFKLADYPAAIGHYTAAIIADITDHRPRIGEMKIAHCISTRVP